MEMEANYNFCSTTFLGRRAALQAGKIKKKKSLTVLVNPLQAKWKQHAFSCLTRLNTLGKQRREGSVNIMKLQALSVKKERKSKAVLAHELTLLDTTPR